MTAHDLLNYLIDLQINYDLTKLPINYYYGTDGNTISASTIKIMIKYDNPELLID